MLKLSHKKDEMNGRNIVISQIVLIYKHRVFAGVFSLGAFKWLQL